MLDLDAYLTFWAGEGLIGHWDGYADDQNNFFFYVKPQDGKIHFIPWGTDDTFGRGNPLMNRATTNPTADPNHAEAIVPRAALARRLYEMPDTKALYLAKLQQKLDTVWNPTAHLAEVDRMQALIQPVTGDLTTQLAPIRQWINDHRAQRAGRRSIRRPRASRRSPTTSASSTERGARRMSPSRRRPGALRGHARQR